MKYISKYLWSTLKTKWVIISAFFTIFIIGLVIGPLIKPGEVESPVKKTASTAETENKILFWTCSMDTQIKQEGPGGCPICGMGLVPMREEAGVGEKASLKLGERARHLASVNTTQVNYRKLSKSIYTVGKIDYDESRVAYVTAWVSGRVDKLYVNFTGAIVKKGERLVYMYSPDLLSAQDEYILAYRGIEQLKQSPLSGAISQNPLPGAIAQSPLPGVIASSRSLLESARNRLLLWGITVEQIEELERVQKPQIHLTIYTPIGGTVIDKNAFEGIYFKTGDRLFTIADLSRVWLYLDIYEYDIPWIRYGQDVEVITESYPREVFHGTVVFIDPFLNEMTRTVKVRVNLDNSERMLKPGMYVNARLKVELGGKGVVFDSKIKGKYMCPMHPDVISDKQSNCSECGMKLKPVGGRMGVYTPGLIQPQYECPIQCEGSTSDVTGYCSKCWRKLIKKEDQEELKPVRRRMGVSAPGLIKPQYECPIQCEGSTSNVPKYCSKCWRKLTKKEDQEEKDVHVDKQPGSPGKDTAYLMNPKIKDDIGVLAVPHSAVLFTGKRNIVYVEKEEGIYVQREVTLGPKADEYYPVINGLNLGESVVISGNFLIDSQMQLLGKPSLLFPDGPVFEETVTEKKEDRSTTTPHKHKHNVIKMNEDPELKQVIQGVLDNYYAVTSKLASDSVENIDKNLDLIVSNSKKVRNLDIDIPENLFKRLSEITKDIEKGATEIKEMELEETRKRLKDLSQSVIMLIKEFYAKMNDVRTTYVYYCSMADASWLQNKKGTLNPYYGSAMLKCGSMKEELP